VIMTVNVTQEDIDSGVKNESEKCPVGLAMARHHVLREMITSIDDPDRALLSRFMCAFDEGRAVQPFEFAVHVGGNDPSLALA
jgi:hypothetical protein